MASVSVVIPVYNAEAYLGECLDSLATQTMGDFEAICVDDGSTDSSPELLRTRAGADARIRVITKPNGGPSQARNAGIEAARGDFVLFLDADDVVARTTCERIVQAGDGADAVAFAWTCFGGRPNRWLESRCQVPDMRFDAFEPALLFDEVVQPFLRTAIRRDVLTRHSVRFDEALRIGEDAAFLFAAYPRMGSVRLVSEKLYGYRLPHEGSLMNERAASAEAEALHSLNTAISVFGDWACGGFLDEWGAELVAWSVKYALYTMLRCEQPARSLLASSLADLWRAHWSDDQLRALDLPVHVRRLMVHALNPDAGGLSLDLAAYRLAEYGAADLATTAFEALAGRR